MDTKEELIKWLENYIKLGRSVISIKDSGICSNVYSALGNDALIEFKSAIAQLNPVDIDFPIIESGMYGTGWLSYLSGVEEKRLHKGTQLVLRKEFAQQIINILK
jgi:hypothetical protein